MYRDGIGSQINFDEAVKYYQIAASENHVYAMFNLADMYKDAMGEFFIHIDRCTSELLTSILIIYKSS